MAQVLHSTLFSDFLTALGVPHTRDYSDERFRTMTFKSLFGLSKLLQSYGVDNETLRFEPTAGNLEQLDTPFLAQIHDGFAIVTDTAGGKVTFQTHDKPSGTQVPEDDFIRAWTGVAMAAYPTKSSAEPGYASHHLSETLRRLIPYGAACAALVLICALCLSTGIWRSPLILVLLAVNIFGAAISWLLVQKSAGIHSAAADRVCSVIERTGCNTVLATDAARFLGVVNWSAVGMGYFSINIIALLLAPQAWGMLALLNICCLPYSFWSVWYQHWRAGAWCTMCLFVQASLWTIFIIDLAGGLISFLSFSWLTLICALAAYVVAVLGVNALTDAFKRKNI